MDFKKPDRGKYKLTDYKNSFMHLIEGAYTRSDISEKKKSKSVQKRQFSEIFIKDSFSGRLVRNN